MTTLTLLAAKVLPRFNLSRECSVEPTDDRTAVMAARNNTQHAQSRVEWHGREQMWTARKSGPHPRMCAIRFNEARRRMSESNYL